LNFQKTNGNFALTRAFPGGRLQSGKRNLESPPQLAKAPTAIAGPDEITRGGLTALRPTLVCGGPCRGKTVLAMEFLVRGARQFGDPGLFFSFEENPAPLIENFASLGLALENLIEERKLESWEKRGASRCVLSGRIYEESKSICWQWPRRWRN
jgi:hypothetical protein